MTKNMSSGHRSAVASEMPYTVKYGQQKHVVSHALLSATYVVFYTSKNSLIRSFFSPEHLQTFLITAVMMYVVSMGLAQISQFLDLRMPWTRGMIQRLIAQAVLGVAAVSFIALQTVYIFYELSFGIDLRQTQYLERDFVLVMTCIAGINVHHHFLFYWAERQKLALEHAKLEQKITQSAQRAAQVREKLTVAQSQLEHQRSVPKSQQALDRQLDMTFHDLRDHRPLKGIEIAAFLLDEDERKTSKIVHILLWDGSKHALRDIESLASIKARCPFLFLYAGRDFLINRYAVKKVKTTPYGKYELTMRIPGVKPRLISNSVYDSLRRLPT